MKLELLILGTTIFLVANTYYDNKYTKKILSWKKYYTMIMWGFLGLSLYIFSRRHPGKTREMVSHANNIIQYMPIDKKAKHMLNPIFNFTTPQENRILNSGNKTTKRSVSETKKKYVAANQNWLCGNCQQQLPAWFEVDHKVRLDSGGSNHVDNLVALCRNCHGHKTALENL